MLCTVSSTMDCALHGVVLFGNMKKEMAAAMLDAANGKISAEDFLAAAKQFSPTKLHP